MERAQGHTICTGFVRKVIEAAFVIIRFEIACAAHLQERRQTPALRTKRNKDRI
jgi:hypothetical protein